MFTEALHHHAFLLLLCAIPLTYLTAVALGRVLKHWGVIEGTPDTTQRDGSTSTRHMMVRDSELYSFSPAAGLFEPSNVSGEEVKAGEPAGWLHFVEDVDRDR